MTKVVPSANDGAEQAVPKTLDPATVNWSDRPVPADGGVTRVSVELNVHDFKVDTHNGEFLQATFWVVLEWGGSAPAGGRHRHVRSERDAQRHLAASGVLPDEFRLGG